jgi:HTH-type transcriptional regulator / antitoxin HigA
MGAMNGRVPAEVFPPGEFLRDELDELGWTAPDLAKTLGQPSRLIDEIISGERAITHEIANGLGDALGTGPEFWVNLESSYRDALAKRGDGLVPVQTGAGSPDTLTPPTDPTALRG